MNRLAMPLRLLAGLAAIAVAFTIDASRDVEQPVPLAASADVKRERVLELPEDGDLWQTIKVGNDQALDAALAANPRLKSLVTQTQFYDYQPSHWWVKKYHAGDPTPMVIVQTDKGRTIYKAYGNELPRDGEALADEIEQRIADCCPEVNRPAKPGEPVSKIPILRPTNKPAAGEINWLAILAIAAAAWLGWRNRAPA